MNLTTIKRSFLLLIVAVGFSAFASAQGPPSAAGPMEVLADVAETFVEPGETASGWISIVNHHSTATITVELSAVLVYVDETGERLSDLPGPLILAPGSTTAVLLGLPVSADAPSGTARFAVVARLSQVTFADGTGLAIDGLHATRRTSFTVL